MAALPSAVLLAGDPYLSEQKFLSLVSEIRSSVKGEVPSETRYLSEIPLEKVLLEARGLPFLAAAQIFRLKEADEVTDGDLERLEAYFAKPTPETFLIFESPATGQSGLGALIAKNKGQVVVFDDAEKRSAGSGAIRAELKRAGKTITPEALRLLEEETAGEPVFLQSLVNQLVLYSGESAEITEGMVEAFHEDWKKTDVFTFTDALAAQKRAEALLLLKRLLDDNDGEVLPLIGLLHWQIRRFWQAKVLLEGGQGEQDVMKKCRVSYKQASFFMRQLRMFSRTKLENALDGLFKLDWKIKTGQAEAESGLEQWVVRLTS